MKIRFVTRLSAIAAALTCVLTASGASVIIVDENAHGTLNGAPLPGSATGTDSNPPPHTNVLIYGPLGFNGTAGAVQVMIGQTPGVIIRFNGDGNIRLYAAPGVGVNDNSLATAFQPPIPPFPVANTISVPYTGSILKYTPSASQSGSNQPGPGYDATNTPTYFFLFSNTSAPTNLLNPVGSNLEDAFQMDYVSNLNMADSVVNVTNSGSSAGTNQPMSSSAAGAICANVYLYQPNDQLLACCSCLLPPNGLASWPVIYGNSALLSKATAKPSSVLIKMLATAPSTTGTAMCDPTFQNAPYTLAPGLSARGTRSHRTPTTDVTLTETLLQAKALSMGEAQKLKTDCTALGTSNQCPGCLIGGLSEPAN